MQTGETSKSCIAVAAWIRMVTNPHFHAAEAFSCPLARCSIEAVHLSLRKLTTSHRAQNASRTRKDVTMQTAIISSLSANFGRYGVTMVSPVAASVARPYWGTPKHPR
jgi:hypothetical protein